MYICCKSARPEDLSNLVRQISVKKWIGGWLIKNLEQVLSKFVGKTVFIVANDFCWIIILTMKHHISLNNVRTRISKIVLLAKALGGCIAFMAFLFSGEARAANILANSGFESGSLTTNWLTFGTNNSVQSGPSIVHGGSYYYKVYGQSVGAVNYTGIYQINPSAPGDTYSADGWVLFTFQ